MSNSRKVHDIRINRTRKSLYDALLSLMDEKGFEFISVYDLTKRAEINRVTFYLHYQDKYDLLDQTITEKLNQLKKEVDIAYASKPLHPHKAPRETLIMMLEHIYKNSVFYKVMFNKNPVSSFVTRFERLFNEFSETGFNIMCPNCQESIVNRNIYIQYASSAQVGVIKYWLQNGMKESPRHLADQLTHITNLGLQIWGFQIT